MLMFSCLTQVFTFEISACRSSQGSRDDPGTVGAIPAPGEALGAEPDAHQSRRVAQESQHQVLDGAVRW